MAARRSFIDAVSEGIADAARDVRQKVVEEPWFGRQVTPEPVTPVSSGLEQGDEINLWGRAVEPDARDAADDQVIDVVAEEDEVMEH